MVANGFLLKRENRSRKDLYIQLVDYQGLAEMRLPREDEVLALAAEVPETYGTSLCLGLWR